MPGPVRPHARPGPIAPPETLVFTRARVREVDRLAVEQFGVPSIVLMENAAIGLLAVARRMLARRSADRAVILCGPGNNGGDGLALARHLHNAGAPVRIVIAGGRARYSGDAAVNLAIVERTGLHIAAPGATGAEALLRRLTAPRPRRVLLVDALLGTGLDGPVTGPLLGLIRAVNRASRSCAGVLAVDIPSGLDCDTGRPLGDAVRADITVSFVGMKAGFLERGARAFTGRVVVAGIGAPRELVERLGSRQGRPRAATRGTPRRTPGSARV